jgi:hypothetical protein
MSAIPPETDTAKQTLWVLTLALLQPVLVRGCLPVDPGMIAFVGSIAGRTQGLDEQHRRRLRLRG